MKEIKKAEEKEQQTPRSSLMPERKESVMIIRRAKLYGERDSLLPSWEQTIMIRGLSYLCMKYHTSSTVSCVCVCVCVMIERKKQ